VPEGDTVWLSAKRLNEALAGAVLTASDFRVPEFATLDLTGHSVHAVVSRGKHLLMRVGELSIHTHLKMEGSWHLYRPGSSWRRPAHQARLVLRTADWVAVGFSLGITEVVATAEEGAVVGHLGPDLLGADWAPETALRNLQREPAVPLFVALLDQRNLAGLGNEYVNELCFLRGMLPTRAVGDVTNLPTVIDLAGRLILANRERAERITTGDSRPGRRVWVYGRAGKPCLRCGTRILQGKLGATPLTERVTFWCPACQR
jgi:endonuclease-8